MLPHETSRIEILNFWEQFPKLPGFLNVSRSEKILGNIGQFRSFPYCRKLTAGNWEYQEEDS